MQPTRSTTPPPTAAIGFSTAAVEPAGQLVYVTAAQLSELSFATSYGTDTVMVRANAGGSWSNFTTFTVQPPPNPVPPAGTTAELVMVRNSDGAYEFYDIGHNTILLDGPLGQIDPAWQAADMGGFNGNDTADLLMRDPVTGVFELYDVSSNAITGSAAVGQVGLEWQVAGFGDFSGNVGETDMLMRGSLSGVFEVYDISNNAITRDAPYRAGRNRVAGRGLRRFLRPVSTKPTC